MQMVSVLIISVLASHTSLADATCSERAVPPGPWEDISPDEPGGMHHEIRTAPYCTTTADPCSRCYDNGEIPLARLQQPMPTGGIDWVYYDLADAKETDQGCCG